MAKDARLRPLKWDGIWSLALPEMKLNHHGPLGRGPKANRPDFSPDSPSRRRSRPSPNGRVCFRAGPNRRNPGATPHKFLVSIFCILSFHGGDFQAHCSSRLRLPKRIRTADVDGYSGRFLVGFDVVGWMNDRTTPKGLTMSLHKMSLYRHQQCRP
jgi:hypothetical protein